MTAGREAPISPSEIPSGGRRNYSKGLTARFQSSFLRKMTWVAQ